MWRKFLLALSVVAFAPGLAAAETRPTEESVLELMEVLHVEENVSSVDEYMAEMIQSSIKKASSGQTLDPERQKILDDMESRMLRLIKEETSWQRMKPEIIEIYRDSYTQKEIDAMLEFYGSPVGQSVVGKMRTVMGQSMQVAQQQMMRVMPRIQKIQQETLQELRRLE